MTCDSEAVSVWSTVELPPKSFVSVLFARLKTADRPREGVVILGR